jgi:hypothetical protein
MESLLYITCVLLAVVAVCLAVLILRLRRDVREKHAQLEWIQEALERCLKQLESSDESEILAAIQTLSVLNEPLVRRRAFIRLTQLTDSNNRAIASQARHLIASISKV